MALPSPVMSPASITPSSSFPASQSQSQSRSSLTKSTSQQSLTSPTKPSTPSTPSSKNYHPYLIHSSASSLLTRTNSSPAQPASPNNYHRSSRSMSSLNHILENTDEKQKEDRRRSMESPQPKLSSNLKSGAGARPGVRRSGTLPEFLSNAGKSNLKENKEIDLPLNPKTWTPSELAQYLGYTLRTGGPEATGHILPAPLVEDIKSWVLRQRVSGRDFLKGSSDGWGNTTRPPPFLPLLQTIARRLRRHSLSGRIESVPANPDDSFGRGSILMEENEDEEIEAGMEEDQISGVRRMANAFDARSSSSVSETSASGDEEDTAMRLRPQLTGESVGERWKAWEERSGDSDTKRRGRKVSDVSASSIENASDLDWDQKAVNMQDGGTTGGENQEGTIKAPPKFFSSTSTVGSQSHTHIPIPVPQGMTPPPPYTSAFPDNTNRLPIQALPTLSECLTPERRSEGRYSATPTPERPVDINAGLGISTPTSSTAGDPSSAENTPSKLTSTSTTTSRAGAEPLDLTGDASALPHMHNMSSHSVRGSSPYAALRRTSNSGSSVKYPSVRHLNLGLAMNNGNSEEDEEEEGYLSGAQRSPANAHFMGEELEGSRWTTARRVTLKPSKVQHIFEGDSSISTNDQSSDTTFAQDLDLSEEGQQVPASRRSKGKSHGHSEKEQKMNDQMDMLINRIKELENKLETVTPPPAPAPATLPNTENVTADTHGKNREDSVNRRKPPKGVLDLLGLGSNSGSGGGRGYEDDGLPKSVRELPVYLFLVGFGVGAVFVRVLFGRSK
ncbi:uncharacterized protein I303_100823 [Kwoniella dejecticola CBS 10117]|uniref:Uncharacterized protein n=1 Tax=Kwoniella dejecticola CBS 10117 TaxID=1296121 RepID=A0A1A6AG09_9TREE|nr:uncharacterized protein I303_00825 [Kwoniella dejecticola CBS 10117]OBR89005.1 hypothetical protein I303_00825 [Kwoniella dejecticola CBS 10117]